MEHHKPGCGPAGAGRSHGNPGAEAAGLATGFSRGYLVSAGVLVLALIIALFMMLVRHQDPAAAGPEPMTPAGDSTSPSRV